MIVDDCDKQYIKNCAYTILKNKYIYVAMEMHLSFNKRQFLVVNCIKWLFINSLVIYIFF